MKDPLYEKTVNKWKEVMDLPPQTVGPLTPLYKKVTRRLKVMPWMVFLVTAIACAIGLYLLFGPSVVSLVSLLQRGF